MRVDPQDALRAASRLRSRRTLPWSVLLAVIVVAAAGISGTTHFAGPRWVPNIPAPTASNAHRIPVSTAGRRSTRSTGHLPPWVVIAGLGVIAAIVLVAVAAWLRRRWSGRDSRPATSRDSPGVAAVSDIAVEPEPDTPVVRSGIELALAALDEQREPADAIVRAWLGLQQTAEESGIVRGAAETPTEFTSRIIGRAVTDDRAIRTLLRLYLRTRFGDHPVTADDVAIVRAALDELVGTWRSRGSVAGAGVR